MKNIMKNTNRLLAIFTLAVTLAVTISSCKKEDDPQPVATTTTTTTEPQEPAYLFNYYFVHSNGNTYKVTLKCHTEQEMLTGQQLYGWFDITKYSSCTR